MSVYATRRREERVNIVSSTAEAASCARLTKCQLIKYYPNTLGRKTRTQSNRYSEAPCSALISSSIY